MMSTSLLTLAQFLPAFFTSHGTYLLCNVDPYWQLFRHDIKAVGHTQFLSPPINVKNPVRCTKHCDSHMLVE